MAEVTDQHEYVTRRNKFPVTVLTYERKSDLYPVVALVHIPASDDMLIQCTAAGRRSKRKDDFDLVKVKD